MKKIVLAAAFAGFEPSAAMADGPSEPEMDGTVVIETTESSAQGSSGGLLMPLLLLAAVAALAS